MPKEIEVKSILNKKKKRDSWFLDDYTFNPYSSCGFNCFYCYIRGSKYGQNLANSLSVKVNAIEVLEKQLDLRARKGEQGFVVLSSATDPYLNIEKERKLTRQALELLLHYQFPVHMITKSDLIIRDLDLLKEIDQKAIIPADLPRMNRGVIVSFSFSTLQDPIANIFEPSAPLPSVRLKAVETCVRNGLLTGISLMPLIPYISDTSEQLHYSFSTFKEIGVHYLLPATITLFGNERSSSKTLMLNAIAKHFPELLGKYQNFFANGTEMPAYYRNAFYTRMKELGQEYDIPLRIV